MINKIATISIIILFVNISSGQIRSLVPVEYEISDLNKDLHIYDLDITNLNSDTILFDWTLDYSFTPLAVLASFRRYQALRAERDPKRPQGQNS